MGDNSQGMRLPTRVGSSLRSDVEEVSVIRRSNQLRLQSKPLDGKQVEPALEDPVKVRGRKAR